MEHAFNVNIATQFDIDTALFLQNLKHWTLRNLANKKNIHDGLCWSYDTQEALSDIFPYWSRRQIQRVINNCIKNGLIEIGNYNKSSYDKTNWYALTIKSYWYFPELCAEKYIDLLYSSIAPNGAIERTEWCNRFPRSVQPIPDTDPDTDPNTITPGKNPVDKNVFLTEKELLTDNPHNIDEKMLKEWIATRKKRKAPITQTAWDRTNKVMSRLVQSGLNAQDCFERMVASGWQGMEFKYFEQDLKSPIAKTIPIKQDETNKILNERRELKNKPTQIGQNFAQLKKLLS